MEKLQPSIHRQKLRSQARSEIEFSKFQKTKCRYCDNGLEEAFLDLGLSPLANSYPQVFDIEKEEFLCPLRLVKCPICHLIQLTHVVPPQMMFSNYLYVSSTTQTFRDHFSEYAKSLKLKLKKKRNALAVDIGSNDGLLLSCYQREGMKAIGVEPAENLSKLANESGLTTINRFFDVEAVKEIIGKYGRADIVSANNVFAHIDDIQSVLRNVNQLLEDSGIFVIEFPYLVTMIEDLLFDMIYHEHLSYISVLSLSYVLDRFGFRIFEIDYHPAHGGSLRVFIQKIGGPYAVDISVEKYLEAEALKGYRGRTVYEQFASNVERIGAEIANYVSELKSKEYSIAGYGAPAKATTLTNFCSLNREQIDFVVDDNPLKQNRLVPGTKIPIVPSTYFIDHPTDYVIIFAWNFEQEILQKLKKLKSGIRSIIPLPELRVV
ncbi:MAG: class I SAM-dependent methyltransferase [Candidatus Omnitrophica bacterium]|nr:class I SAM-dependent methyltransferase [Candidatus Omnitrophota bacterium]